LEEKKDTFREWTSRRPWKERKRAARARENAASRLVSETDHPELIFYGKSSGVVGLSKDELYQTVSSSEVSSSGYDKVNLFCPKSFLELLDLSESLNLMIGWNFIQVLVDAECTHDGSIRHIQKFEHWGWETLNGRVLNAERSDNLTALQVIDLLFHYLR